MLTVICAVTASGSIDFLFDLLNVLDITAEGTLV